ncbi:MAG: hypothetical protein HOC71_13390 [Candidatus Latescibacteria bacterium]|jgi:hypothetical protein|nr:hypothetical protein [Candidatus Latescibacterota bacterium]
MNTLTIKYCFTLQDDSKRVFNLLLDAHTLELTDNVPEVLPSWTNLDFHQCSNCPLSIQTHPHCPLAANLVNIVKGFDGLLSYDDIHLDVFAEDRVISQNTTAQKGISSLMGIVNAASGCPHTVFFRPMARFHLPLASEEETIYRASSMYMLAQYFLKNDGKTIDLELMGLAEIYNKLQVMNTAVSQRLRAATKTDSSINAVIMLHTFSVTLPYVIEESLEEIRYLFYPYIKSSLLY